MPEARREGEPVLSTAVSIDLVTVKGVKYFRGSEGYGYNATVYIDGKKTALAINHGDGGMTFFEYVNPELKVRFQAAAKRWVTSKGREDAFEPEGLFLEAKLKDLEDQKAKAANAKKGLPITIICFAGARYAEDAWEKEFYLGVKDEASLKNALVENKVVEWRRV